MSITDDVKQFLLKNECNTFDKNFKYNRVWLRDDNMEVYVRHTQRYIKSRGTFRNFLKDILSICSNNLNVNVIFIENVLNKRLAHFLNKNAV